jgi:hypothetical protein
MATAGEVLEQWYQHYKSNIGTKQGATNAHMNFSATGAPVKKLWSYYIIGDTTNATECYITGHGGSFDSDYFVSNRTFKVPAGVTVNFYQPDGYVLGFGSAALRNGPPIQHGGTNDQIYTGGQECTNYILTKDQGKRMTGNVEDAHEWEMDYASSQEVAGDLGIVLVTIRNRWFQAGTTLSSAIDAVRDEVKTITTFNCLFCRVREGSTSQMWNAVDGNWT